MSKIQTAEVFGLSRHMPINYVERETVDNEFRKALNLQRHIVIHGGSKQGKSSLIRHCLEDDDYITIHCNNSMGRPDINANILKRAGFKIEASNKKSASGHNKLLVSFNFGVIKGGGEINEKSGEETTRTSLELDIDDVNDVVEALKQIEFTKYIILEDFHYLTYETQRDFCISLKAFHEQSTLIFIIVGVWLEENRLIYYNGDLTGRVVSINADTWSNEELEEVIEIGTTHLNISFSPLFTKGLILNSHRSVFIVQEICREACLKENILERQDQSKIIGETINTGEFIAKLVNQQVARYTNLSEALTIGTASTELEFYQWIIHSVFSSSIEKLELGLHVSDICSQILDKGGASDTNNLMKKYLKTLAYRQMKQNIRPIIFDYEHHSERLKVVDKGYLIWLNEQDPNELIRKAGLENLRKKIF